jgi:hypothetical protein
LIEGPRDGEVWVVPEDGAFAGRVVAASGLVEDLGGIGQDEEAMRKTFGNPQELKFAVVVTGLKIERSPTAEVWRLRTEIDGDVPDVAGEDADEFSLGMTELIVKSAEDAPRGKRLVVLGEGRGKTERGEGIGIEEFREPAARIAVASWLQDFYIAQGGIT